MASGAVEETEKGLARDKRSEEGTGKMGWGLIWEKERRQIQKMEVGG